MSAPDPSDATSGEDALDPAEREFLLGAARIPPRAPEPDRVGQIVGPYRLGRRLGQGGMGVVHEAIDARLDRKVALKLVRRREDGSSTSRRRLLREARAAASIHHPDVATVYEVGEHDDETWIAMELIGGRTLRERMAGAALPVAEATRIALRVARALGAAHRLGIVHRDLKPENVMCTDDGGVKVVDFGLATLAPASREDGAVDETSLTGDRIVGTPSYMAPEQTKGDPLGPPADVFALGVVLYEMLTGRRPFEGKTPVAIAIAADRDRPVAIRSLRPAVPPALAAVVERCIAKHPGARPADGAATATAIEQALVAGDRRWRRGALAVTAALVAAGAIAVGGLRREPPPPEVTASIAVSSPVAPSPPVAPAPPPSAARPAPPPAATPSGAASGRRHGPRPAATATAASSRSAAAPIDPLAHQK